MHDWKQIVHDRLGGLRLNAGDQKEVVTELASHLEELHEALRKDGLPEQEAFERCMKQLSEARLAEREIEHARSQEGAMNYRTKTLWVPGLITLTLASVALMLAERIVLLHPRVSSVNSTALAYYLPWLLSLPFCGALGAYLSRRAGGKSFSRFASAVFPAAVMLGVFFLILPVGIFIEKNTFIIHHLQYFAAAVFIWTVIPGAALLLGAVMVSRGEASHSQTRLPA